MKKLIVLQYTSILDKISKNDKHATTKSKFEFDIKSMLEADYKPVSLFEAIKQTDNLCNKQNQKLFSIVFVGGYLDNYTNAFDIIKRYNIKVAVFLSTDLVGLNSYPGMNNFIPHFGWSEAQEMINSSLVNIYPLWHYFDRNKNFSKEIKMKMNCLDEHIVNNGNIIAVSGCTIEQFNEAKSYGIEILLCNFETYTANNSNNNLIPMICVNYDEEALDIVDQYLDMLNNSSKSRSINNSITPNNTLSTESVILPIEINPIAKNYLHISTPLSVIGAIRKDKLERQVANHLIDVIFKPQYDWFDYHCNSYEHWDCLDCKSISKEILDINGMSVVDFIIKGLHLGYYCDVWLDVFYIQGKIGYNTIHYSHGILIYGYDSIKSLFHTVSYDSNGLYRNIDVELKDFEKACSNEYLTKICLLKNKAGINAKYNKNLICEKLKHYLDSYHYEVDTSFNQNTPEQYVQYNACLKFSEYIEKIMKNDEAIPVAAMYSYTEHKYIMAWRIQYIMGREILINEDLTQLHTNIAITSKRLLTLSLKYNMTKNQNCNDRIINMINLLNALEKIMIETFLSLQS